MIKSSKVSLKYSNTSKKVELEHFIEEYRRVVSIFIDILWDMENVTSLLPKNITDKVTDSWLSQRAIQSAGKQASAIVRGTKTKYRRRLWQINKFKELGQHKKARKLQYIHDQTTISKPHIHNIQPELDSRFVSFDMNNNTSFDGWIILTSLGNKMKLILPFKKHKQFNNMLEQGTLKQCVRLSPTSATLMFDTPDTELRHFGVTVGIDIGQTTTLTLSTGQSIDTDAHGHTYGSICKTLARKKKGSKNFKQTDIHRSNYIRWAVNQVNLDGIKQINIENIKHMRRGKRSSRILSHWNYAELFGKLEEKLIEHGVHIHKVSPTYTSQRCSACGWVRKGNRKGKQFKCDKCAFACDADLNGSLNITLNLPPIGKKKRLLQNNKTGFYWPAISEAPIVPHTQETLSIFQ
jgi:IS605 OrfB family transposase